MNAKESSLLLEWQGKELTFSRVVAAPRALVWEVWTEAEHLAQWWGPYGFTNPLCEVDLRIGGELRIHMQGPDGNLYPSVGKFQEIREPERLTFTSTPLDEKGDPLFETLTIVTFTELAGQTRVDVQTRILSTTPHAALYLAGMQTGWTQNLERLATYLLNHALTLETV